MNVLIACEESQRVCIEFRKKGHNAYSCDILECSGGHPEWHIKDDVLGVLNPTIHKEFATEWYGIEFNTMDGERHRINGKWDLIIAHPPCTYLSNAATRSFSLRVTPAQKVVERWEQRALATVFFMKLFLADCDKVAVENPVGFMSKAFRKPEQIIDPYMFAESKYDKENYVTKRTCLWLKGLTPLKTNNLPKPNNAELYGKYSNGKNKTWEDCFSRSAKVRSKTFPGIAKAMAEQWG